MDLTYTLKPQLRIKITNIYLDETVTLIQYIKLTSARLCYDDVQLYDKLYKMYHDNHQHNSINELNFLKSFETIEKQRLSIQGKSH